MKKREEDEDSKESINTEFDEWGKFYMHSPAEFTATAAIARMDKYDIM
jgi:alpha-L-arabinofuranosidase